MTRPSIVLIEAAAAADAALGPSVEGVAVANPIDPGVRSAPAAISGIVALTLCNLPRQAREPPVTRQNENRV